MAFIAAGIATFAFGTYNYAEIVHAITRVARGHACQDDQRLAEEGLRRGNGLVAERAVEAAAEGLTRLHHVGEVQRLHEVLERVHQTATINT